jgi:hypothetical protein
VKFVVRFEHPVVYQPDHPTGRRTVSEIVVNTDTESAALLHAVRVTQGDPGKIAVLPPFPRDLTPADFEPAPC